MVRGGYIVLGSKFPLEGSKGLVDEVGPPSLITILGVPMSHPVLRIKWSAESYVRPEISHTHKPTNYR